MSSARESVPRWVAVARAGELSPGQVRRVEVEGRVLVLVNVEGIVYAVEAVCPHRGGPLDQGKLWRGALECPWHHFRFDPATGANVYPRNVYPPDMPQLQPELRSARAFPVEVRGEEVLVNLGAGDGCPPGR
jgi:nitrite reductase/ring-hydroxylating ferredoxin subunit